MDIPSPARLGPIYRFPVFRPLYPAPDLTPQVDFDPDKREIRRILRIVAGVLIGVYCFVAIIFSSWALFQPSPPEFGVSSGSLSSFNLTGPGSGLSLIWTLNIVTYNPNKPDRVFYYKNFLVSVSYDTDYSLAENHVGPFSQPGKNWSTVQTRVVAMAQYLNDDVRSMMEADTSRGVIAFNVDMAADVRYETVIVRMATRWETVVCIRVKFELGERFSSGVSGTMVEANPVSCKPHHQRAAMFFVIWFLVFFLFILLIVYVFL